MLKPWLLYIIIAWYPVPGANMLGTLTESQHTVVISFDYESECNSVSKQVAAQIKEVSNAPFFIKANSCLPCDSLVEDQSKCPPTSGAKAPAKRKKK